LETDYPVTKSFVPEKNATLKILLLVKFRIDIFVYAVFSDLTVLFSDHVFVLVSVCCHLLTVCLVFSGRIQVVKSRRSLYAFLQSVFDGVYFCILTSDIFFNVKL
jgi:hypothetical protein